MAEGLSRQERIALLTRMLLIRRFEEAIIHLAQAVPENAKIPLPGSGELNSRQHHGGSRDQNLCTRPPTRHPPSSNGGASTSRLSYT